MALRSTKNINSKTLVRFIKRGMELLQPQNETSKIPTPIQSQQKRAQSSFIWLKDRLKPMVHIIIPCHMSS